MIPQKQTRTKKKFAELCKEISWPPEKDDEIYNVKLELKHVLFTEAIAAFMANTSDDVHKRVGAIEDFGIDREHLYNQASAEVLEINIHPQCKQAADIEFALSNPQESYENSMNYLYHLLEEGSPPKCIRFGEDGQLQVLRESGWFENLFDLS